MEKSEYSEEQLEKLLMNLPKIKDHRNPQDIYQNISIKMKKRKNKSWILPSIATAAAMLIFVVLAPNIMNWNDSTEEASDQNAAIESQQKMQVQETEKGPETASAENNTMMILENEEEKRDIGPNKMNFQSSYTALYEANYASENVFTFAVPDAMAQNIVPVSVVVPKEDGKTTLEQLEETMAELKEKEWNLSDYYPLNANLELNKEGTVLNVDVPAQHFYGDGSASEIAFRNALSETAKMLGVDKVTLSTEGIPGIEFGNMGNLDEMKIEELGKHAYFFYYPKQSDDKPYIVPYSESFKSVETALNAMKENIDTHGLTASIPSEFRINEITSPDGKLLVIRLDDNSKLIDNTSLIHTIEAILLTAKDFDYEKVKIENSPLAQAGMFVFNEEWELPIAPNLKTIEE